MTGRDCIDLFFCDYRKMPKAASGEYDRESCYQSVFCHDNKTPEAEQLQKYDTGF